MMETLIQFAESWWPLYAVHVAETSVFILLVWTIDHCVRLDTRLRYSLWLCALVKAFVPPFYALPLPAFLFEAPEPVAPVAFNSVPVWDSVPMDFTPVVLPPEPIPFAFWIFALWSFSALGFVGVTLWRNRVFQRALGIANPVELSGDLEDLTQGAKLRVFSKANLNSPLLVGVMKPRLYLPSSWQTWTPTQLRGVVAHELAHYHNRDLWTLSFQVMATVLFGLNPLSWLVNRRLAHLRELRCDEDALQKSGISPVEYSKLLYAFLDAKAHPGLPALGFTEKDTPLKKRFEHVLNFKGGNMNRSKWQLAVPILVALAIVPFSIRETYSQAVMQPQVEILKSPEVLGNGTYGMMFNKRTLDVKRSLLRVTAPKYPTDLLKQGIAGQIELSLVVDAGGHVEQVTRIGGDQRFERPAIDALKEARFRPATNGQSTSLKQKVLFKLKDPNGLVIEVPESFWNDSDLGEMVVWGKASNINGDEASFKIKPTKQIPPVYPEHLRESGVEGYVLMDVTINANGQVGDVRLLEGNDQFEPAARVALKHFRFTPFSHATTVNKKQIVVFKLAGNNRALYSPAEEVMGKSDFGPMVVMAMAPGQDDTGGRFEPQKEGQVGYISFSPKHEPHIKINMGVRVLGQTEADQQALNSQNANLMPILVKTAARVEHDVFFEEGMLFQMRQDIRFALQKELNVKIKDVMLENITAESHLDRASDIWVNYKGDIVINMNRPVSVDDLDAEFQTLKASGKIQSLSLRVDIGAPKNVIDAIQQSAARANLSLMNNTPSMEIRQRSIVHYPQEKGAPVLYASVNPEGFVRLNTGNAYYGAKLLEALRQFKTNGAQEIRIGEDRYSPPDAVNALKDYARQVGLNVVVDMEPIIPFYKVDQKPKALTQAIPVHPANAQGQKGKVILKFLVNTDGSVSHVSVLRGEDVFHQAAMDAVKQYKYQPAKHQGKVVPVWMTQPINFNGSGTQMSANSSKDNTSEIWINTKGQVLIDMSKPVTIETLGDELAQLKQQKGIHTIRLKQDRETPMAFVQKALDAAKKTGLAVQMVNPLNDASLNRNLPLDPNNLQFYQVSVKPESLEQARPHYPKLARLAGVTGKVFLKFRVNEDGSVGEVTVLKGAGIFRKSAIEAIQKFKFKPAEHEGKPVAVWMTQPISYRLDSETRLVEQQVDLPTFTVKIPNGQGGLGNVQSKLTLTVVSEGIAEVIRKDPSKAQQAASTVLSQTPYDQWATPEQQTTLLNNVRDQINGAYDLPLVKQVTFSDLLISPTEHIAANHEFKLHSNFPNPFNPQTSIKYEVAEPVFVRMEIYNVTGQVIRTLVAKDHTPGQYETRWDGKNDQGKSVASGIYYYHINAGSFNAVNKMQLVK